MLTARGIDVFVDPVLAIETDYGAVIDENGMQGILFTSANGVRAFAALSPTRDVPAYAVGDRTAREAADLGFSQVLSANGNVDSLAQSVRQHADPAKGYLLHPAGTDVAGDLAGQLAAAGFVVRRVVIYSAHPANHLTGEVETALRDHEIDMALLYSPRTAKIFVDLVKAAGLERPCEALEILCLSQAVADAADDIMWRRVMVAPTPTQDSLLQVLDERLKTG